MYSDSPLPSDAARPPVSVQEILEARRLWREAPAMSDRVLRQWWGNVRMRWNCHSTAIEGSSLSYRDTLDVLVYERAPDGNPPLLDVDQMRGHDQAAQRLAEMINAERELQMSDLHAIHRLMLVQPYPAHNLRGDPIGRMVRLGQFKISPNVLMSRGNIVEFADPQRVPWLMREVVERMAQRLDILRHDPEALDPAAALASTHWDFIAIHPYDDGNGRMVRWLTNYMCMLLGYPPLVITLAQKDAYFACFQGMDPLALPGVPAAYQKLRDFLAARLGDALRFGEAVAQGRADPSWRNEHGDPQRPATPTSVYPSAVLTPRLRPQDRRDAPDGTAL